MSKWIVHLEGGGWCYNEDECAQRSRTPLGSSKSWAPTFEPQGFLSDNASANADFYDWNVVFVKYCDGASFAGNRYSVKLTCMYPNGPYVLIFLFFLVMVLSTGKALSYTSG